MDDLGETLIGVIKSAIGRFAPKGVTTVEVVSVNTANNTCSVREVGTEKSILGVRLISVMDNFENKTVIYPAVGSIVAIAYLWATSNKAVVVAYSETDGMLLNGDTFGGMVKADVLKTEIDKLRDYVSTFKSATVTALNGIAGGSGSAIDSALTGKNTGDFSSIKNDKVKHG